MIIKDSAIAQHLVSTQKTAIHSSVNIAPGAVVHLAN